MQMISSDNTEVQTSYELEVTNRISGEMVFHTGKVQSEQSQLVKIKTLPVGDYNWRVRVWNKSDEPSSWSDKGRFIITNVKASFGEVAGLAPSPRQMPTLRKAVYFMAAK